jgi:hypothetical protein
MAPAMRISTVEFRSLLLPPVRVPIHALRTFYRPQCAPVPRPACPAQRLEQRRALNLYKTAKAKTVLGQHKVLNFTPWEVDKIAPLEKVEHRVKLWETDKNSKRLSVIADNIPFQELLDKHVDDGKILYSMCEIKKGMAKTYLDAEDMPFPEELKDYAISKAHTYSAPKGIVQKGTQIAGLKNIIFNESSPVNFFRMRMDQAYQFLERGCAVEFRLRLQGRMLLKEERIKPAGPERWTWMHQHMPHLRPDFIMKAMPKSTRYLVNPVSNGRVVQWVAVLGHKQEPEVSLDKRLFRIKDAVIGSIKRGNQAMLPKIMRQQLRESGSEDYSINTGLPKALARAKHNNTGKKRYSGEEKRWLKRDAETDRFLQPDENVGPPVRAVDSDFEREMRRRSGSGSWQQRGYIGSKNGPKGNS